MTSVFVGRQYEDVIMAEPSHRPRESAAGSDRRTPEADELIVARLTAAAQRHAPGREPTDAETAAAVEELNEITGARGDLLAEVAGLLMGYYGSTAEEPKADAAAHFCVSAGADLDLIPRWIEVGRRRAAAARQAAGAGPDACGDNPGASI
ncbi:MAG TPA: hypothetical protein VGY96_18420 [Streptosporangiaceae bacterium]|jgi:hypothetical protein|nr:hypothetical protein [Streptosporangiaceae bacterium]